MLKELTFPAGCHLLKQWQSGDSGAADRLKTILDATIDGQYDRAFSQPAPQDAVHASASLNLMTLKMVNQLCGLNSEQFYKGDPERYVRTTLMSRRLLGLNKLYLSWPVYAFTAEAIGQVTLYTEKDPPGTDPDQMLINHDNWRDVTTPDFSGEVPRVLDEMMHCYKKFTGDDPVLHLSAPYSLAADTYGQEQIATSLAVDPEFVSQLLNHLVDHVLQPWMAHFFKQFPNGWVELSDATGSPFFIGPENCRDIAIRSIRRLVDENSWGQRVYDANYRGDYVTQANSTDKNRRRRKSPTQQDSGSKVSLAELLESKHSVCPDFVIRLDDDRVDPQVYAEQAIEKNVPLFLGIGASQIDRNNVADLRLKKQEIDTTSRNYVETIKTVANTIKNNGYHERATPWPGVIYFEDVSAESNFDLIEIIVGNVLNHGQLD